MHISVFVRTQIIINKWSLELESLIYRVLSIWRLLSALRNGFVAST